MDSTYFHQVTWYSLVHVNNREHIVTVLAQVIMDSFSILYQSGENPKSPVSASYHIDLSSAYQGQHKGNYCET